MFIEFYFATSFSTRMYMIPFFALVFVLQKLWRRYVKPERGSWIPSFDYKLMPSSHVIRITFSLASAWWIAFGYYLAGSPTIEFLIFMESCPYISAAACVWVVIWTFAAQKIWKEHRAWNPFVHLFYLVVLSSIASSFYPRNTVVDMYELPFLTPEECDYVIAETLKVTNVSGWTVDRHSAYPTNDMPIHNITTVSEFMNKKLIERLYPFIQEKYGGWYTWLADGFVVRYTSHVQASLDEHVDGGDMTFNLMLSDLNDYESGGTYIRPFEKTVRINKGRLLLHPARIRHAGIAITGGTRYILVGFLRVEFQDRDPDFFFNTWGMWPWVVRYLNLTTLPEKGQPLQLEGGSLLL
eukprot:comp68249_c0_seq1/m.48066 comp68249_c0_seq1/g.48066  ORF comp68249_c0_seq1/g.48066 comp68249_c0_seq1/m.48066 type:complete len:353 (-) comp68249_c0_seq1:124-1182(-)